MSQQEAAIHAEGLGKRYPIVRARHFAENALSSIIGSALTYPWRQFRGLSGWVSDDEAIWALKDATFEIGHGEVVGVVGHNGSGKSTLLKVLSEITSPTEGRVIVNGRITSLLEVGTGFHPELSGRENIFLNGAILGMRRSEIRQRFDEIVEFANVATFLDTPVKRYSSGMYVRLAFSIAAHLTSEILAIDEVLAVGDAEFQAKCLGSLGEAGRSGRTILFVSHNMQAVRSLCSRAIQLSAGRIVRQGSADSVVSDYLADIESAESEIMWEEDCAPGIENVKLLSVRTRSGNRSNRGTFLTSQDLYLEVEFVALQPTMNVVIGLSVETSDGARVLQSFNNDMPSPNGPKLRSGRNCWVCRIPANFLNGGRYLVSVSLAREGLKAGVELESVVRFDMVLDHAKVPQNGSSKARRFGVVAPLLDWQNREAL